MTGERTPPGPRVGLSTLWRYGMAGGLAAVVDLGAFLVLLNAGLAVFPAGAASFLAAMLVNYTLSSRLVFRADLNLARLLLFAVVATIGLTINAGVTYLAVEIGLFPAFAKIAGIGSAFLFNYLLNTLLVFRH